ncbi:hypothetical protein OSB71_18210 [Streptomyces sp. JHD 1]|nr:hypothetical protein [Streptomyces sp. JHD 1]
MRSSPGTPTGGPDRSGWPPPPAAVPARREQGRGRSRRRSRDARPTRGRDRDGADGRPRGHPHASGPSRVRTRAPAHTGHLPGRLLRRPRGEPVGGRAAAPAPRRRGEAARRAGSGERR